MITIFCILRYMSRKNETMTIKNTLPYTIILTLFCCFYSTNMQGQTNQPIPIQTVDMRGEKPTRASIAAIKNSRKGVVVVLLRGANQELIDLTTGQLRALTHNGYNRVGLVLSDLKPKETLSVVGIVSDGTAYAAIKDAKPDKVIGWKIYNLVKDAYEQDIWPKMGKAKGSE